MYEQKRTIPKDLDDCCKDNLQIQALWSYSNQVESWGKGLLSIIILFGTAIAIFSNIHRIEETTIFNWQNYFTQQFLTIFYAVIANCICRIISLILGAAASITHSNRITSSVALLESSKSDDESNRAYSKETNKPESHNSSIAKSQPDNYPNNDKEESVFIDRRSLDGYIICPKCGTAQRNDRLVCLNCGVSFTDASELSEMRDKYRCCADTNKRIQTASTNKLIHN